MGKQYEFERLEIFEANSPGHGSWDRYALRKIGETTPSNKDFIAFVSDAPNGAHQQTGRTIDFYFKDNLDGFLKDIKETNEEGVPELLSNLMTDISNHLYDWTNDGNAYTTCTIALRKGENIYIISKGDSLAYLVGDSYFQRVNEVRELTKEELEDKECGQFLRELKLPGVDFIGYEPDIKFSPEDVFTYSTDNIKNLILLSDGFQKHLPSKFNELELEALDKFMKEYGNKLALLKHEMNEVLDLRLFPLTDLEREYQGIISKDSYQLADDVTVFGINLHDLEEIVERPNPPEAPAPEKPIIIRDQQIKYHFSNAVFGRDKPFSENFERFSMKYTDIKPSTYIPPTVAVGGFLLFALLVKMCD